MRKIVRSAIAFRTARSCVATHDRVRARLRIIRLSRNRFVDFHGCRWSFDNVDSPKLVSFCINGTYSESFNYPVLVFLSPLPPAVDSVVVPRSPRVVPTTKTWARTWDVLIRKMTKRTATHVVFSPTRPSARAKCIIVSTRLRVSIMKKARSEVYWDCFHPSLFVVFSVHTGRIASS